MLYGWTIDYLINRYSIRLINDLHDIGYQMQSELMGAEIQDEWTEEERQKARDLYYTEEEKKAMNK